MRGRCVGVVVSRRTTALSQPSGGSLEWLIRRAATAPPGESDAGEAAAVKSVLLPWSGKWQ